MTDPMLDGITRWITDEPGVLWKDGSKQYDTDSDYLLTAYVLFSDLPALIAAVREAERSHFQEAVWTFDRGYEQGQRDERDRIRTGVTGLSEWPYLPPSWSEDFLAVIDGLKGEQA